MIERKYGRFCFGVPSTINFGELRGFAVADGVLDAVVDGTGISFDAHAAKVTATPTAIPDNSARRITNLICFKLICYSTDFPKP
jgi:hypothetical protein